MPEIVNKKGTFAHLSCPFFISYPRQLLLGQGLASPLTRGVALVVAVVAVVGRRRARAQIYYFSPVRTLLAIVGDIAHMLSLST